MSALTPGLSALLDTVTDRFAADKARRELELPQRPRAEVDGQLSLMERNVEGGFTSFEGERL